jgi:uncharacterized repeat protein (TIGR03803 family)
MRATLSLAVLAALGAVSAFAAEPEPTAVFTFTCNGSAFLQKGTCPQGGRSAALIQGADGNFYGTAEDSNEGNSAPTGGTAFSLTPSGKFTLLHTFLPGAGSDYAGGNLPGALLQGPDGELYGQTNFGGIDGCNGYCGYGLLYRLKTNGAAFQVLHQFCSDKNCTDGEIGSLAGVGSDGNVYGSTEFGGTASSCPNVGCGVIFQITPSTGAYKVVFNFDVSTTGAYPGSVIAASDGTFYGLAFTAAGQVLFHYIPDTGAYQTAALLFPVVNGVPAHGSDLAFGANGNLYGLYSEYAVSGLGLFEVEPSGSNLQLFPFYTTIGDGGSPDGLLLATDGNFWVANSNGSNGYGDIITLSPTTGTVVQTLSPFSSKAAVGAYPTELIQATDGTFWGGTAQYGEATKNHFGDGTVFSLNAGLPPR